MTRQHGSAEEQSTASKLEGVEIPRHVLREPEEIFERASDDIREKICETWAWLPDEPEAKLLADQLAAALFTAVRDTRTQPETLLKALLAPRPLDEIGHLEPRIAEDADEVEVFVVRSSSGAIEG